MSTLAQAMPGGLPLATDPAEAGWPELPVVAVTRSHYAGLEAAQVYAAEVAQGRPVRLLGLIIVADTPGRLPKSLETLARLVGGGYRHVWRAGWVEAWRQGEQVSPQTTPRSYRLVFGELMAAAGMNPFDAPADVSEGAPNRTDGTDRAETKETA